MMRSLYWKIFVSFWLTTTLIILTTAFITSEIAKHSSIPVREKIFINSYANAAVATYESGHHKALKHWLEHLSVTKHMRFYLLSSNGEVLGSESTEVPNSIKHILKQFINNELPEGIFKEDNLIVSHEILTLSQTSYRFVAILNTPIGHLTEIPWTGLSIRLVMAILFSGIVCYFLSLYLTKPLRLLRYAAKSLAHGHLDTRVKDKFSQHRKDEIAELGSEFDIMAEKLEALVASKERLLQDISHELRSPIARLQVALEIGRNKTKDLALSEFDRMELEIQRLNELIGEILSLAKLNNPSRKLNLEKFSLSELIQEIVEDANFESGSETNLEQTIERVIFVGDKNGHFIIADKTLIHRALENIIRNAIRYSPTDKQIKIKLLQENNDVKITILDRGPGVPESDIEQIFSPFYRVDTSREKRTGGYGLGLAITKQAIALHHGNIYAKNRDKGGLAVTIKFPIMQKES